ncbi:MAG: DUF4387 domain-containing protein [Treponema sp.]|jgi:hypothetical protein|nr:DUF4387 domain-containing protein [Treponema sp.]
MAKIKELARYVRSKNAGPFWVTIEIFCDNKEAYETIKNSGNITGEKIAELYHVDQKMVKKFCIDNIMVIKFSYPRPMPSGHKYENDMHAGQQYIFLANVEA